jgi:macrolide transport system ATP-binding/permease protein
MTELAFHLERISFAYNSGGVTFAALNSVDLKIRHGEFVAVIGPSGSGKSTLLNILGLLARPSAGELSVCGKSIINLSEDELADTRNRDIGFVFQNFSLVSRLTVLENILLPSAFSADPAAESDPVSGVLAERAEELLRRFGIHQLKDRLPNELSGGQKQRVAICRAILLRPRILLADEPTGALDSASALQVMQMLEELHREGSTVIIITHDPDVAGRAHRVVSIFDGSIKEDRSKLPEAARYEVMPVANSFSTKPAANNSAAALLHMLRQSVKLAKRSLAAHRIRSFLTGLGLFIGILSLIVIDGLGEIVENSFNKLFYTSSVRKAYIYYDADRAGFHGRQRASWRGLHAGTEFPRLAQMFSGKGKIRPFLRSGTCQIKSNSGSLRSRLAGVSDPDEFLEMDTPLTSGRWVSGSEFAAGSPVAVLGSDTVNQLFKPTDERRRNPEFPVGERLTVDNCNTLVALTIIGVLDKRDTSFGNREANDIIYVPNNTLLARMGPTFYTWFSVLPDEGVDSRKLASEITSFLSLQSGGKLTFGSSIPADILQRVRGFLWIIQAIVGFIGALCLFVGGVGIMNMMLVTVAERTREIGLLKSLGARPFHIRSYVLTESVLLCFWAGCAAIAAGLAVNNLFSLAVSQFVPMLKDFRWITAPAGLTLGLLVSVGCGLGFGALPAGRAARLDPAECLRSE